MSIVEILQKVDHVITALLCNANSRNLCFDWYDTSYDICDLKTKWSFHKRLHLLQKWKTIRKIRGLSFGFGFQKFWFKKKKNLIELQQSKTNLRYIQIENISMLPFHFLWPIYQNQYQHIYFSIFNRCMFMLSVLVLGLCPANERQCYFVTMSLIGWTQACSHNTHDCSSLNMSEDKFSWSDMFNFLYSTPSSCIYYHITLSHIRLYCSILWDFCPCCSKPWAETFTDKD